MRRPPTQPNKGHIVRVPPKPAMFVAHPLQAQRPGRAVPCWERRVDRHEPSPANAVSQRLTTTTTPAAKTGFHPQIGFVRRGGGETGHRRAHHDRQTSGPRRESKTVLPSTTSSGRRERMGAGGRRRAETSVRVEHVVHVFVGHGRRQSAEGRQVAVHREFREGVHAIRGSAAHAGRPRRDETSRRTGPSQE